MIGRDPNVRTDYCQIFWEPMTIFDVQGAG